MNSAVVILAGGEGQRIGGGKPQRLLAGRTLLDRAIALAHRQSAYVAVSLRDPAQLHPGTETVILDDPGLEGPLAGLSAALRFAQQQELPAVLTLPCDAPFLPDDLLGRLSAALSGALAAVPSSNGQLHPTCALWDVRALDRLPSYAATGRRSLKGFAEHVGYVEVPWTAEPRDPFFNINSEEDLGLAEKVLNEGKAGSPLPRG